MSEVIRDAQADELERLRGAYVRPSITSWCGGSEDCDNDDEMCDVHGVVVLLESTVERLRGALEATCAHFDQPVRWSLNQWWHLIKEGSSGRLTSVVCQSQQCQSLHHTGSTERGGGMSDAQTTAAYLTCGHEKQVRSGVEAPGNPVVCPRCMRWVTIAGLDEDIYAASEGEGK